MKTFAESAAGSASCAEGKPDAVVVLGPTAAGKTALAVRLARAFSGEILSADSRQVYRGLDIGTGKDLEEYGGVRYHLIDILSLPDEYNVFRFQQDFRCALAGIRARGNLPVLAGGTGLYLESVICGYAFAPVPENAALRRELETLDDRALLERLEQAKARQGSAVHPDDRTGRERMIRAIEIAEAQDVLPGSGRKEADQPPFHPLVLGVYFPREELRTRIAERLDARLQSGLLDEVRRIHAQGISWERLERLGLEYRCAAQYLRGGGADFPAFRQNLLTEIRHFAKRQETWFRRMERRGVHIRWITRGNPEEAERLLLEAGFRKRN